MAFGDKLEWPANALTAAPVPAEDLLDAEGCAAILGITTRALHNWIKAGTMIDGVVIGGKKRWSKTIVANYVWGKFVEQQQQLAAKGTAGVESTSR